MKILYMDWDHIGKKDLLDCMEGLGYNTVLFSLQEEARRLQINDEWIQNIKKAIEEDNTEKIFSIGYFPTVSEAAKEKGCQYISWIYDSLDLNVYAENITNDNNRICIFDYALFEELSGQDIHTVYHVPFAVNTERCGRIKLTEDEQKKYGAQVSYVDCFNGKNGSSIGKIPHFGQLMFELGEKDEYTEGYLEGLLEAQMQLYGCDILTENITEELYQKIIAAKPLEKDRYGKYMPEKKAYIDDIFCRYMASAEQERLLKASAEYFETFLYTDDSKIPAGNCVNKGKLDLDEELPKVIRASKVNLSITNRSSRTGIPYLAMQIMGAGGFLLTSYQNEFFNFFEPDVDFSYFSNKDEMIDKIQFFCTNETERAQIAGNALKRIEKGHTLRQRLEGIFG